MSIKMIATRPYYDTALRKEYRPGVEFEVSNEAEADRLERRKKAKRDAPRSSIVDLPAKAMKPAEAPVQPEAPLHQSYLRRDMQASPIGEDNPLPSSRRGRPPKVRTSASFEDDSE
jgi:hypothetical protein